MPTRQTADYDPLMDELPPDLAAEYMAERRRRKISEAMLGQSQTPLVAPEVKGRFQGAISPFQGLAQVAKAYMANKGLEGSDAAMADIGRRKQEAYTGDIDRISKVMTGRPENMQGQNYPAGGNPDEQGGMGYQAAVPAGSAEQVAQAMMASKFPSISKHGFGQLDAAQKQKQVAMDKLEQIEAAAREGRITREEAAIARASAEKIARAENAANREAQIRIAASLRPAPQPVAPTVLTDSAGNVTLLDRSGNVVKKLKGAGKPSAGFEKAGAAKKKMTGDLDTAITELEKATADGGLIDKSTGSGAGAAVDAVAGFFGKATPGAVAVGQTAPIFDLVLKMVPRFEGPQSDKDTQSYKEASGQLANPNTPNEIKKAAGKEILRLMKQRKGQFIDKAIAGTEADIPSATGSSVDALLEKYK